MIDELIKEIQELEEYKEKYFTLIREKQIMSDRLYELMWDKYKSMTLEDRIKEYKDGWCSCCRHDCYDCDYPEDILMPIKSDKACIPDEKTCGNFRWA